VTGTASNRNSTTTTVAVSGIGGAGGFPTGGGTITRGMGTDDRRNGRPGLRRPGRRRAHPAGHRAARDHPVSTRPAGSRSRRSGAWTSNVWQGDFSRSPARPAREVDHDEHHRLPRPAPPRGAYASAAPRSRSSTTTTSPRPRSAIGFVFQSFNLLPRTSASRKRRDPAALPGASHARSATPRDGGSRAAGPRDRIP